MVKVDNIVQRFEGGDVLTTVTSTVTQNPKAHITNANTWECVNEATYAIMTFLHRPIPQHLIKPILTSDPWLKSRTYLAEINQERCEQNVSFQRRRWKWSTLAQDATPRMDFAPARAAFRPIFSRLQPDPPSPTSIHEKERMEKKKWQSPQMTFHHQVEGKHPQDSVLDLQASSERRASSEREECYFHDVPEQRLIRDNEQWHISLLQFAN